MSIERALTMLVKLSTARILSSTAGCVWPLTPKISGYKERWLLRASGYNERWLNHADVADEAEKGGLLRVAFWCCAPRLGCFWELPLAQASSHAEALRRDNNK
jgi:hypothetical protein